MVDIVAKAEKIYEKIDFYNMDSCVKMNIGIRGKVFVQIKDLFQIFKNYYAGDYEKEDIIEFIKKVKQENGMDMERMWIIFVYTSIIMLVELECRKKGIKFHYKEELYYVQ